MEKKLWTLAVGTILTMLASVWCSFSVRAAAAQSTEMDRPTRLSSPDASVVVDRPVTHYYAFDAGPGEITVLVAVTHLLVNWDLLDPNLKSMTGDSLYNSGSEDQKITRITLTRKATVVLKLRSDVYSIGGGGSYRFRVGGAVDVGSGSWISNIPHQGILTVKMKDGSIKEIDLKEVAAVSVR